MAGVIWLLVIAVIFISYGMGNSFEWLVRHERIVATVAVLLIIALVVQMRFCKDRPAPAGTQLETSQNPRPPAGSMIRIAGQWEMSVQRRSGAAQTWALKLEQSGGALTGVITSEGGDLPVSGTIHGQEVGLSAKRYGVTVEFSGRVEGDTMRGTMSALSVNKQWIAKRK